MNYINKFKKPVLTAGFLVSIFFSIHGQINQQYADSLKSVLATKDFTDGERLVLINEIARSESDPSELLTYGRELLALSERLGDLKNQQIAHLHLGNGHKFLGHLEAATDHFVQSGEISNQLGDKKGLGEVYGSLASLHRQNGNYDAAQKYFNLTLSTFSQLKDTFNMAIAHFNFGNFYYGIDSLELALSSYQSSSELAVYINHELLSAYSIGNRALVKIKQGETESVDQEWATVFEILDGLGDSYGKSDYLYQLSELYKDMGEMGMAEKYALESLSIAKENKLKETIRDASKCLSEIYLYLRDYKNAFKYQSEYMIQKDSITNTESIQKIADLRTEFEVGQKQAEVDLLTAEKKTQRVVMISIAAFAFILFILAIVIYQYYQTKSRINKELEALNQTKDKFFSIISHDLRGPVSSFFGISRMIKFLVQSKETEQLLEIADDIDESVERLSTLLDNLLTWAMQQQGQFPNHPEKLQLADMAGELVNTLGTMAKGKKIDLSADVQSDLVLWADKNTTMTILRNLVNNALKFTPEGGQVTISAERDKQMVKIRVSDTGVGIPKEKMDSLFRLQDKKSTYGTSGEKGLGLGLQLVHEFIEMNGGSIEVESETGKGTTFVVSLPLFVEK